MTYNKMVLGFISLATIGSLAFAPLAIAHNGDTATQEKAKSEIKSAHTNVMVGINPSGKVQVRGATVTSLSGATISATTVWGSTTLSWTLITDVSTKFVGAAEKGRSITLADIKVGDVVTFEGAITTGTGLTVSARVVHDQSITTPTTPPVQKDTFQGTLQSIASTTAPTSVMMKSGNTVFTVVLPAGTTILKSNFSATTLATFQTGDTVRVYGSIDATNATTINALVLRNATR